MGFFNSLKGQIGRDTGRVISNKVFGNRHASKYQRVDNTKSNVKTLELEHNYKIDLLVRQQEMRDIDEKKAFVNFNLKKIISMKTPNSKELLIEQLHTLSVEITFNKWKNILEDVNKISNTYSDAVLKKYEQHLFTLKTKFPNAVEIHYFEKQGKTFNRIAYFKKYKFLFWIILLVISMSIGIYYEKDKPKKTPIKDFFESLN